MLLAVRSTSCAAASENAIRELVGSAMSNPSEWVHGRDMASPRSCCYWPHGQGEASQGQSQLISPRVAHASRCVYRELILIDYVTESPNVGDDRSVLLVPDPVRLAIQVEEPTCGFTLLLHFFVCDLTMRSFDDRAAALFH